MLQPQTSIILLVFYVTKQHKVVRNCEMEGKEYVVLIFFSNKNLSMRFRITFQ